MPFRHVVMFRWADHVGDDHVDRVREGLDALPPVIGQIRSYVHGADVGVSVGNFDYALVADFDNVDDFRTYRDHPQHVLFIEEVVKGNVAERASVQFATPDDRSAGEVSSVSMRALLAEPDDAGGDDDSDVRR